MSYFKLALTLVAIFTTLFVQSSAKVYSKCDFVAQLKKAGLPQKQWGTWACIAQHESKFNTQAINQDTKDYGILQISSIYWCNLGSQPGKGCGITCKSLLVDDISGSIKCAKKVYSETSRGPSKNGFTAWTTYKYCMGDQSGYVKECHV